jgi:WD40 repeat protein
MTSSRRIQRRSLAVLRQLVAWLTAPRVDGRVQVVTGGPGAGKSGVVAWLVLTSDQIERADPQLQAHLAGRPADTILPVGSIDAAILARGKPPLEVLRSIATAAELPVELEELPPDPRQGARRAAEQLIEHLVARGRPIVIVVDALDESSDADTSARMLRRLGEGIADIGGRVLVATRPGPSERLLYALGHAAHEQAIAVDSPQWLEVSDLAGYVTQRLLATADPAARTPYRGHPELAARIAAAVAKRAAPLFLVAQLVSRSLVSRDEVVDVGQPDWQNFPNTVADAMDDYLAGIGDERVQQLLLPLAFAQGDGLPRDRLWVELATRLAGRAQPFDPSELDWLVDTAADFLVERRKISGQTTYRLYHQALVEYLRPALTDRDREWDQARERVLVAALRDLVPERPEGGADWWRAHSYTRAHLANHAARTGQLDELLDDPGFLLAAEQDLLLAVLAAASSPSARQAAGTYWRAVDQLRYRPATEAAAYLQLYARRLGADVFADRIPQIGLRLPWSISWMHWQPDTSRILGRRAGRVNAVAMTEAEGRPVSVTGTSDRTVRVWDLREGTQRAALEGHAGPVNAIAIGQVEGRLMAITGSSDRTVRLWDVREGIERAVFRGHTGSMHALALGEVDGRPVLVSGSSDRTVRLWDIRKGIQQLTLSGHTGPVNGVAIGLLDQLPVALSGSSDRTVRLWDLRESAERAVLEGHTGWVRAVALGEADGRPIAVSGGDDATLRVWDLRESAGRPNLEGHTGSVDVAAVGKVGEGPVAVTGGHDGTVRIWNLRDGTQRTTLAGHNSSVRAVAIGEADGRSIAVSASSRGTVRVWDLRDGTQQAVLEGENRGGVMALGVLNGHPIAVMDAFWESRGRDDIRVWDGLKETVLQNDFDLDRTDDRGFLERLTRRTARVAAVGLLDGQPVAVTSGSGKTVSVWDLRDGTQRAFQGIPGPVNTMALGELDDRPVAVTGGFGDTVSVWNLRDGSQRALLQDVAGPVNAVAVGQIDRRPAAVTGGQDGALRVWNLYDSLARVIQVEATIKDVAITTDGMIVAVTNRGILAAHLEW